MSTPESYDASKSRASSSTSPIPQSTKPFACVLCSRRKVRCDRLVGGCTNCTKARVECVYIPPPPPRRRKRGAPKEKTCVGDSALLVRLRHYEELLGRLGVHVDGVTVRPDQNGFVDATTNELNAFEIQEKHRADKRNQSGSPPPGMEYGKIVGGDDRTRYLANELFANVIDEHQGEIFKESFDDEPSDEEQDTPNAALPSNFTDPANILLGQKRPIVSLTALHPSPVVTFKLWQKFLENVSPCCRILHCPTAQQVILEAAGNLDRMSRSTEALMFAVYCCATTSLNNDLCEDITGEPKAALLPKWQFAAQQALANAQLLRTSDLTVLQAFLLYLLSIDREFDPREFWCLTGTAVRIGQRMGIHRDGAALGLSVFQTELRRRLWWEIVMQDGRAGELAGCGSALHLWDCRIPLNINDSSLTPGMREPPMESTGPTEMIFVRVRMEIGEWLRRTSPGSAYNGVWNKLVSNRSTYEEKVRLINELEEILERKFFSVADLSIPIHFLAVAVGRGALSKMRFTTDLALQKAHQKQQTQSNATTDDLSLSPAMGLPDLDPDAQLKRALNLSETTSIIHSSPFVSQFSWFTMRNFHWEPFIFMLSEMRHRTGGEAADRAWKDVGRTYELHPEFLTNTKRALHVAIGNLTLQAWYAYEQVNGTRAYEVAGSGVRPPRYILELRKQRSSRQHVGTVEGLRRKPGPLHAGDVRFYDLASTPDLQAGTQPSWSTTASQANPIPSLSNVTSTHPPGIPEGQSSALNWNEYEQQQLPQSSAMPVFDSSLTDPTFDTLRHDGASMENSGFDVLNGAVPLDWQAWDNLVQQFQSEELDMEYAAGL